MANRIGSREVCVAVETTLTIGDFTEEAKRRLHSTDQSRKRSPNFVRVSLTDEELALNGEAFIKAAREALFRSLGDSGQVMLCRWGLPVATGDQKVGVSVDANDLQLKDEWWLHSQ